MQHDEPTTGSDAKGDEHAQSAASESARVRRLEELEDQVEALADLRDRLLASIRELIDGYQAAAQAQPGTSRRPRHPQSGAVVTLSAGPFSSLDAVRAFELAISEVPGVIETSLRGYAGEDRAIVDVRLTAISDSDAPSGPTP